MNEDVNGEEYYYYPEQLATVTRMIMKFHKNTVHPDFSKMDDNYMKLIRKIIEMKPDDLETFAYTLTDSELCYMAGFMARNAEGKPQWINDDNLYTVMNYVLDTNTCEAMFYSWQNYYDNMKFNTYFEGICRKDEIQDVLKKNHMKSEDLSKIIISDMPYISIGKYCVDNKVKSGSQKIDDLLEYYGIIPDSRLFNECKKHYYTFCDKDAYISVKVEELIQVVSKYNEKMIQAFLNNYLPKFSLKELNQRFFMLALFLDKNIHDIDTGRYSEFFGKMDNNLKLKYRNWINSAKIVSIFGDNVRSNFWKNYMFKSVRKHNKSESFEFRFEDYVAVEFLGDVEGNDFGPMYLFDVETFESKVKYRMDSEKSSDFKSYLFNNLRNTGNVVYKRHAGFWEAEFDYFLLSRNVTERIIN